MWCVIRTTAVPDKLGEFFGRCENSTSACLYVFYAVDRIVSISSFVLCTSMVGAGCDSTPPPKPKAVCCDVVGIKVF